MKLSVSTWKSFFPDSFCSGRWKLLKREMKVRLRRSTDLIWDNDFFFYLAEPSRLLSWKLHSNLQFNHEASLPNYSLINNISAFLISDKRHMLKFLTLSRRLSQFRSKILFQLHLILCILGSTWASSCRGHKNLCDQHCSLASVAQHMSPVHSAHSGLCQWLNTVHSAKVTLWAA